jgi:hypothetical protein
MLIPHRTFSPHPPAAQAFEDAETVGMCAHPSRNVLAAFDDAGHVTLWRG